MEDYGYYQKKAPTAAVGCSVGCQDNRHRHARADGLVYAVARCRLPGGVYRPPQSMDIRFPGLVFPAIYVAEVLLGLWWVVRWKKYAFGVAAVLLLGIGAAGVSTGPTCASVMRSPNPRGANWLL